MRPFHYERATDGRSAINAFQATGASNYVSGGTTLIDLMKLDVMRPERVVDISPLAADGSLAGIQSDDKGLRLGAFASMAQAADHPDVLAKYPAIAQSLQLAASAQLRNMALLGGNVLQRTRCTYFRDTSYANCNKRNPGSGCAAMDGVNRAHAVLGTSPQCIATYAGDFAQALTAFDAQVEIMGKSGARKIAFAKLHVQPGEQPDVETRLLPGDIITAFQIAPAPWTRRSVYLKVRDRQSYEFALASAAVALDLDNGTIRGARIALGGVATVPWRAYEAEQKLAGQAIDDATLAAAANLAFAEAKPRQHNAFKIELGKRTLIRALHQAAALEIPA
ncbi:MAG TPA: xanthine dehydrogenase family protein subunit M [Pseudolabrys sp.]|jgi:xanthine dehydrogenase YagS FAD-binding subunit|nr:xanthine dehydrogenase family protein subunit M [Pseudolabrys sp.]